MNKFQIEKEAKEIKGSHGGKIFAFPIDKADPFSKYAFTVYVGGGKFLTYPDFAPDIQTAALYCAKGMDLLRKNGIEIVYDRDVRLVTYEAQINAPDVVMRRLRNEPGNFYIPN